MYYLSCIFQTYIAPGMSLFGDIQSSGGGGTSDVGVWLKKSSEAKKLRFGDRQKIKIMLKRIHKMTK